MVVSSAAPTIMALPEVRAGVFLVRATHPILIDCGMRGQTGAIARGVRGAHLSLRDIAIVAITHWHIDHTGSLAAVRRRSGARVVAPAADAKIIRGDVPPIKPRLHSEGGKFARWLLVKLYKTCPVDVEVDDGAWLPDDCGIRVVATPGHTAGHSCYLQEEERALFVGDALVNRDGVLAVSPEAFSDNPAQARQSLEIFRTLRFDRCYFGHGEPLLDHADERIAEFLDTLPAAEPENGAS